MVDAPGRFGRALEVPFTDERAEVDGCAVHYLAFGQRGGRGLVFVHGGGSAVANPRSRTSGVRTTTGEVWMSGAPAVRCPAVRRRRQEQRRYDSRVVVVTGASSGIGRRLALDFAERGAAVVGLARRAEALAEVQARLQAASPGSTTRVCDVGATDRYQEVLAEVEADRGPIDVLVNNAGIDQPTPVADGFGHPYRDIFEVNFFATVAGTMAVVPGMVRRGDGIVLNVASDSARAPEPAQGAYAASKAAIAAFTESVAHEVAGDGVHVHVLYPAWVPTAMGLSGVDGREGMPPKPVRRSEEQVSALVLDRLGGARMEINAAVLPLLAPIGRTIVPVAYQRAMRRWSGGR